MRLEPTYCTVAVLVAVALLTVRVQGQTTTSGALSGVVVDETNAVVTHGRHGAVQRDRHFDQTPTTQSNLPVLWASSDSTIATIEPNTGIATCVVVGGPVTVTASAAGRGGIMHGSSTLVCQLSPDPVVKLAPASLDRMRKILLVAGWSL